MMIPLFPLGLVRMDNESLQCRDKELSVYGPSPAVGRLLCLFNLAFGRDVMHVEFSLDGQRLVHRFIKTFTALP